ncbi:hypothetical protein [Mycobacterium sp.]|uniref:hypothetical protein n=1 Tax=Mycobacterium sp. TaxID=1785 RepID=UPI0025F5C9E2|nr:hypothetical protein [Mycobacterium sp.]
MAVLLGFMASMSALCVGYYWGRRANPTRSTWKRRTSRVALGKRAVNLLVLVAARRIQRKFRREPIAELLGLRLPAHARLSRDGLARIASYRRAPSW